MLHLPTRWAQKPRFFNTWGEIIYITPINDRKSMGNWGEISPFIGGTVGAHLVQLPRFDISILKTFGSP